MTERGDDIVQLTSRKRTKTTAWRNPVANGVLCWGGERERIFNNGLGRISVWRREKDKKRGNESFEVSRRLWVGADAWGEFALCSGRLGIFTVTAGQVRRAARGVGGMRLRWGVGESGEGGAGGGVRQRELFRHILTFSSQKAREERVTGSGSGGGDDGGCLKKWRVGKIGIKKISPWSTGLWGEKGWFALK